MLKNRLYVPAILSVSLFSVMSYAGSIEMYSPDKQVKATVSDDNGILSYAISLGGKEVVTPSRLGMLLNSGADFALPVSIANTEKSSVDENWVLPWGEREQVKNHYNETAIMLTSGDKPFPISLRFRVFNDGIGFRYEGNGFTDSDVVEITRELTEFQFPDASDSQALWIPSRGWNRYEYLYNETPLTDITMAHTPMTAKLSNGVHVSIHEAALVDFAAMSLDQRRPGLFRADLAPRSDGLLVKTKGKFKSSWRTIQLSEKATGLLNSDLILNLNEPNALGNVDWVKPGKYLGIWWGMHLGVNTWESGDKHGATTALTKTYMDFAAEHGFDGVLVEGWNIGWDGSWFDNGDVFSFTQSYPDFDIKAVTDYGNKRGVKLIGHHETSGSVSNYEAQMDEAFKLYAEHGVAQIKTGYVADGGNIKRVDGQGKTRMEWHDSQFMSNHYLDNVKHAAHYKLSINTHEPIKDTGLRRTYPNWLAREGARGQEFNAWGSPPNSPQHTVDLVYTRMLSGPMDFTPGIFNLAYEGLEAENRVQTTLAKQLALYVVLYSPIQMAADLIEHYQKNMAPFQFIKDVPTDWQKSVALAGELGEFAVFARQDRNSDDWYLGAITDEQARQVQVTLDFLSPGRKYEAQIYQDGKNADWKHRPYDIDIIKRSVTHSDTLTLPLATSGGAAIRFVAL